MATGMRQQKAAAQENATSALDLMGITEGILPGTHEENPEYVVKVLRNGLPYKAYSHLSARKDLGADSLLPILGISIATLKRRAKEKAFSRSESNNLYRFARLLAEASNVFNSRDKAIAWFKSPNRALSGDTPLFRLETEIGYQQVVDLISRIKYGIYS